MNYTSLSLYIYRERCMYRHMNYSNVPNRSPYLGRVIIIMMILIMIMIITIMAIAITIDNSNNTNDVNYSSVPDSCFYDMAAVTLAFHIIEDVYIYIYVYI